jgi:hypothetical protein
VITIPRIRVLTQTLIVAKPVEKQIVSSETPKLRIFLSEHKTKFHTQYNITSRKMGDFFNGHYYLTLKNYNGLK